MRAVRCLMVGVCVLAGGVWLFAQQPPAGQPPTFQSGTDIVRLEVSVLDKERRPVTGLTAADFTIREDGVERPVVAFARVELPPVLPSASIAAWVRDAPRDVVRNTGVGEGRLVVIAFDWSIRFYDQATARRIAQSAIDGLGPADQAAVVFTHAASNSGVPLNFTTDRSLLRAAVNQTFAVAETDPASMAFVNQESPYSVGCHCGTCTMDTLTRVADTLRSVSQRHKVVLFIGTYVETFRSARGPRKAPVIPGQIQPGLELHPSSCSVPLDESRRRFERAMGDANATVHVIDPVGLETGASSPLPTRMRERLDSLPVIADLTGGRTVLGTNAPEAHVAAILGESGSYYLLGFTPASTARDARTHRIDVRVRPPGVTVKARDRYTRIEEPVSALESADAGLIRTVGGVLPTTDVPFEVSVVPLVAVGEEATAVVVIGRAGVPRAASSRGLRMVAAAFTPRGRLVAAKRVEVPSVGGEAGESAVRGLVSGLALEPGLHEVRVAAEWPSGTAGSVNTFVDVPDFRRERLSMSGVLVHVAPEEPVQPPDEIRGLPFAPTARRTFLRTETASAFFQVSQGTTRTDALELVTVRVRIVDTRDDAVHDQAMVLEPTRFSPNRLVNARLDLPVQNLVPGDYLLRIEATMGERAAGRAVRFQVE